MVPFWWEFKRTREMTPDNGHLIFCACPARVGGLGMARAGSDRGREGRAPPACQEPGLDSISGPCFSSLVWECRAGQRTYLGSFPAQSSVTLN